MIIFSDELGYIVMGGNGELFPKLNYCKSSENFFKKTEKKTHYIQHSNICIENIISNIDDTYDYYHDSSYDDETETGFSDDITPTSKNKKVSHNNSVSEIIDKEYFLDINNTVQKNNNKKYKSERDKGYFQTKGIKSAIRYISLKRGYYSKEFKIRHVMVIDETKNKKRPFIYESQKIGNQRWVRLEEDWWEENFSCHEPMFYSCLFSDYLGTIKYKLGPEEV